MKKARSWTFRSDSSAIFILLKKIDLEEVKKEVIKYNGKILHVFLSHDSESELFQPIAETKG